VRKTIKVIGAIIAFIIVLSVIGTIGLEETANANINSVDLSKIEDGVYEGIYNNFRWSNTVEVTVKNHQIVKIEVKKGIFQKLIDNRVIDNIINKQDLKADLVTGASVTEKSLLKSIDNALND